MAPDDADEQAIIPVVVAPATLKQMATAIQREQARLPLLPKDFNTLGSADRLKVVQKIYQDNPGYRRELLVEIERGVRSQGRPDPTGRSLLEALNEQVMGQAADQARYNEQAYERALRQREINDLKAQDYNRWPSGLMDVARTTSTDSSNVTKAELSALYRRAARSMYADMDMQITSPAKAKTPKAPPQREVPMAPTPGRRKIRLDE